VIIPTLLALAAIAFLSRPMMPAPRWWVRLVAPQPAAGEGEPHQVLQILRTSADSAADAAHGCPRALVLGWNRQACEPVRVPDHAFDSAGLCEIPA